MNSEISYSEKYRKNLFKLSNKLRILMFTHSLFYCVCFEIAVMASNAETSQTNLKMKLT